ncbi:MFS transporter [Microbacterium paludicola]|uniref:MFS transporter n=1 Tax=Microbacterium paludicola TaxID=300019 RepID=A0A4Y9FR31_9MICO|nr:MFS transporter [Microbacterium paludicola]MBF0817321.1 MFS transporter [Microbacterium paludicola]TFU31695.1 MFS transporter [Microbacterium paludicola]
MSTAVAQTTLRSRLFAGVVAGWALANVADSLLAVILAVWVVDLTGEAALGGLVFAVFGVPALFSPLLGRIADRVSRRRMLCVTYLAGAATLAPLLLVRDASQTWWIFAATILYAGVSYGTAGCRGGILRDLLADDDLGPANSILQTIDQVLRLALPFAAAGVYFWTGPLPIIAVAIGGFLGAAVVFAALRFAESPIEDDSDPFWRSVTAGFRHLANTRPLNRMTLVLILLSSTAAFTSAVGFAVLERMGVEPAWLGPIEAVSGVGGLLAGVSAAWLMRRIGRPWVLTLGALLLAVGIAPMLGDSVWALAAGLGVVGLGVTLAVIAYVTESHVATPSRLQGRVGTSVNMMMQLPSVLITATAAGALGLVDARAIVACGLVMCLVATVVAARTRVVAVASVAG